MHQKWFDGGWSNWASFGGEIASASAAASWGPNRIDVFAQETDNQLIQKWYNGAWYPPENTERSEKVRVTINGFIVRSQTVDHAFNVDGWGDEVYLSTISTVLNSNGEERFYPVERTSAVIGDAEGFSLQDRVKAGTASPWRTGGLKSGDAVPTSTPYNRTGPIQARMVPMTVFEEKLGSGDILTVIPTIWEWDNGTSDAYTEVVNLLKNNMDKIGGAVTVIAGPGSTPYILIGKTIVDLSSALKPIVGNAADRPIGSNPKGEFTPKAIGLNLDKAKTMAETDNGLGKGIFEVNYQDKGGLSENHTLHLQVEMI